MPPQQGTAPTDFFCSSTAVPERTTGWFNRAAPSTWFRGEIWAVILYVAGLVGFYALTRFPGFEKLTVPVVNGFLLAALLLTTPRRWWQWAVVTLVVHFAFQAFIMPTPRVFWFRVIMMCVTVGQCFAEAWVIQWRLKRPVRFEKAEDIFVVVFVLVAVNFLSTPLATWSVSLILPYLSPSYTQVRWLSHTVTALTITPFVVTWTIAWRERSQWQWRTVLQWLALLAGSVVIVSLAMHSAVEGIPFLPAPHLCLPSLAAAAILFRARGAATVALIVAVFVLIAAAQTDVWRGATSDIRMSRAQLFLGIVSAAGLLFGASLSEIDSRSRLLRESEMRYRAAAERLSLALRTSGLGVWRRSLETGAAEWDDRMFAIFGLVPSGRPPPIEQLLPAIIAEDREQFEYFWRRNPPVDRGSHVVCRLRWPGGDVRQVEFHAMLEEAVAGGPGWMIGVANDTTNVVRAAAESESLKAQLQQAQKMEALGNLAAGVAHDFNTLLTGINVLVDLASTTLTPSHEATSLLQQARRGSASARVLVQRILNYSRGSRLPTTTTCNVVELIRETAPLLAAALPPNVSLSLEMQFDHAHVQADPAQLQQVLINLSTNAARAIADKPGKVDIRVERCMATGTAASDKHESHVRISVADDGCGMDEQTRAGIFDSKFRPVPSGEGTGLGLSIVRDIVTAHAGTLEVESSPGKGTVIAFRLPLADALAA